MISAVFSRGQHWDVGLSTQSDEDYQKFWLFFHHDLEFQRIGHLRNSTMHLGLSNSHQMLQNILNQYALVSYTIFSSSIYICVLKDSCIIGKGSWCKKCHSRRERQIQVPRAAILCVRYNKLLCCYDMNKLYVVLGSIYRILTWFRHSIWIIWEMAVLLLSGNISRLSQHLLETIEVRGRRNAEPQGYEVSF